MVTKKFSQDYPNLLDGGETVLVTIHLAKTDADHKCFRIHGFQRVELRTSRAGGTPCGTARTCKASRPGGCCCVGATLLGDGILCRIPVVSNIVSFQKYVTLSS